MTARKRGKFMKECYQIKTAPACRAENVIAGEKYRISVLTDGLVRLEYAEHGGL